MSAVVDRRSDRAGHRRDAGSGLDPATARRGLGIHQLDVLLELRGAAGRRQSALHSVGRPSLSVVLVEGTFSSMYNSFGAVSPDLVNNGYCVYAFNYGQTLPLTGIHATGEIAASAGQLVDRGQQRPRGDPRQQGRPGGLVAGRHDAALLPQQPGRRGQGQHARRLRAVQLRHDARRAAVPDLRPGRARPGHGAAVGHVPGLRRATPGLVVPQQPQRDAHGRRA